MPDSDAIVAGLAAGIGARSANNWHPPGHSRAGWRDQGRTLTLAAPMRERDFALSEYPPAAPRRRRIAALIAAFAWSLPWCAAAGVLDEVFLDDFESGDPCEWSLATLPVVEEGEMPSQRVNDELASAIPVSRCATVEGAIGSIQGGGGGNADFDFYRIDAPEPFLLRWTLEPRTELDDFVPYADLDDDDTLPLRGALPEVDDGSSTRQIWIPSAGSWYVYVSDQRNWDRFAYEIVDPPVTENVDYRLRFEVEPLVASSSGLFLFGDERSIPADGSLVVHSVPTSCLLLNAETFAERHAPPSPLDTRLVLVRPDGGGWVTVADNDDLSDSVLDSVLSEVDTDPSLHYLLVDFVDSYVSPPALPADFSLDLSVDLCP